MKNNRINYKLVNIALFVTIICLIYLIRDLWLGVAGKILEILFPFIIAFGIAYALHPIAKKIENSGFPKWLSVLIVTVISLGFLVTIIILVVPMLYEQILLLLTNISTLITDLSTKYEINLGVLQSSITDISTNVIKTLGKYISDGALNIVNSTINFGTAFIIVLFVSIYLLSDMDKIRNFIKKILGSRNRKKYKYIKTLDKEVTNYFSGLGKNIIIQFIEYTTIFFLIGHPNYLILGVLASCSTIIPIFGGLIVNIIALLIASVISAKLFWLTLIVCCVCPQIDAYIIAPKVYGKTNNIHPLISIFAVFAGGILGGFIGIVVSLPITIIIITTFKFFRNDIDNKLEEIKDKK